jgi:polyisoprenoid-binding protein YceI
MHAHGLILRLFFFLTSFSLLLVLLCNITLAQRVANRPEPKRPVVPSGSDVDLQRSRVYILVGKTGFGHDHGVEGRLASGSIQLGATQNAGEMVFDMATFTADTRTARTRVGLTGETDVATQKKVNSNMRGPDVLDVAKHPRASFRILSAKSHNAVTPGETPIYDLEGQFTLHGVTRPLRMVATLNSSEGRTGLHGHFTILQSDYGITPYSAALGAVGVADKLEIWGDIWMAPMPGVQR